MAYIDTTYRTFTIGFLNTSKKIIFQDSKDLNKILEVAEINNHQIDINSVKELNSYGRFVKIKMMPEWLLLLMSRNVQRFTDGLRMERNEMI